jgi:hypothetical protein
VTTTVTTTDTTPTIFSPNTSIILKKNILDEKITLMTKKTSTKDHITELEKEKINVCQDIRLLEMTLNKKKEILIGIQRKIETLKSEKNIDLNKFHVQEGTKLIRFESGSIGISF